MPNPAPGAPTDRPNVPPPPTALSNAVVILVRTQGPVNLGMVARLCGNLGVTDLRLVNPQCEVNCPEARMFSTHSRDLLLACPIFDSVEAASHDCGLVVGTSGDFRVNELGRHMLPERLPAVLKSQPCTKWAIVFGNEADGLDEAELRACQAWIHLHTFGPNISYNLANAVAISLYVIASNSVSAEDLVASGQAAEDTEQLADRGSVDSLREYWFNTLERFDFFRRTTPEGYAPGFRKFVDRLRLTSHDLNIMRGMLSQFNLVAFKDRFDGKSPRRNQVDHTPEGR